MKILFITPSYYPHLGGVERHIHELTQRLLIKNHEIIIITEVPREPIHSKPIKVLGKTVYYQNDEVFYKQKKKIGTAKVYYFDFGNNRKSKLLYIWRLLIQNKSLIEDADIVHCHDVFIWYLPLRFIFPLKKVFTTFHGYESYPVKKSAYFIHKVSERLSRGNICIGDYIQKWYGTKPNRVSYGAVEVPKQKKTWKNKYSAYFVGRLDEQTSIISYSNAFKKLKQMYPKFEFLVIGDGKYRSKVAKKAKKIGAILPNVDTISSYHFAFVSRYLTTLEAMSMKKLVFVIADNPLKADCFNLSPFGKWVVVIKNEHELVEKVKFYLKHPELEKKHVQNAYNWVVLQTWEKLTELYLNLWRSPLRKNRL